RPAVQLPAPSHSSSPLHRLASTQLEPAGVGLWSTPNSGAQLSAVQRLASSASGVTPAKQVPASSQYSEPLQALPSPQGASTGAGICVTTPVAGSQSPMVQALPSSVLMGCPAAHEPLPSQASAPLQASLSSHEVPAAAGVCVTPSPA